MGDGYIFRCSHCDYDFTAYLGVGMMYPAFCQSVMEKGRKGELGPKLQRFLEEHPDGAVDCENVVLRCTACGELDCGPSLNMYVPKEGYTPGPSEGPWSTAMSGEGMSYITPWDLKTHYLLKARYPHRCEKCGKPARTLSL